METNKATRICDKGSFEQRHERGVEVSHINILGNSIEIKQLNAKPWPGWETARGPAAEKWGVQEKQEGHRHDGEPDYQGPYGLGLWIITK